MDDESSQETDEHLVGYHLISNERKRRGSLLNPLPRASKIDLNHLVIEAISCMDSKFQAQALSFDEVLKIRETTPAPEQLNWKERRRRTRRKLRPGGAWNVRRKLPCAGFKIDKFGSVTSVQQVVRRFVELTRIKKTLTGELFDALRAQFRIIDSDNTGFMSLEKARRMNMILSPHISLTDLDNDVTVLFRAAEAGDYISELRWLRAWASQVRSNGFELDFVRRFVESFARCAENIDMKVLLQCEYVTKFPTVFHRVTSWKNHAQATVAIRLAEEEWQKDRAIRELTGKVDKIKNLMAGRIPAPTPRQSMRQRRTAEVNINTNNKRTKVAKDEGSDDKTSVALKKVALF